MSHVVYLGIGSNIEPEKHVATGLDELSARFDLFTISSVYHSEAVGFDGEPFLNLVTGMLVTGGVRELHEQLREIEYAFGRAQNCSKHSSRTLDIDILTFDELCGDHAGVKLPRDEITLNAFVLAPFAEIAPGLVLPGSTASLEELWRCYNVADQPIRKIAFRWHEQTVPCRIIP